MKFCFPHPNDVLKVLHPIVVKAPLPSVNANADLFAELNDIEDFRHWYFHDPGDMPDDFEFEIPAGVHVAIGQVYIRKGGWHKNSIVLTFNKNQPEPFRKKTLRIFLASFEQIDFEFVEKV